MFGDRLKIDFGAIAAQGEIGVAIEDVGDAPGHACGEISSRAAQHDDQAIGHVLAAVIADAFDHGRGARVANSEAFAGHAAKVGFAAGSAIEADVADEDILFEHEFGFARVVDDQLPAGEALTDIVVAVSLERQRHALGEKCAEALPGAAGELYADTCLRADRRSRSDERFRR